LIRYNLIMNERISKDEGVINFETPLSVGLYQDSEIFRVEQDYDVPVVAQGEGKLATSGRLYSEGFSKCSAFVIQDPDAKCGGLFHISDIDFELSHQRLLNEFLLQWLNNRDMEPDKKKVLAKAITEVCFYDYPRAMNREELATQLQSLGISNIKAKLFCGSGGRHSIDFRLRESLLNFVGIELPETYVFDNNKKHWSILVNFDSEMVDIGIKSDDLTLRYSI
jgi:hypothetical protein